MSLLDLRLRSAVSDEELRRKIGRVLTPGDFNLVLTGPALVRKPNGSPLCIYLPAAIPEPAAVTAYPVLHGLRTIQTDHRGYASGTPSIKRGTRTRIASRPVRSVAVGALDPDRTFRYCRLTSWTGEHLPELASVLPVLQAVGEAMAAHVPERHAVQAALASRTDPAWRFAGTPFTTLTVNNTYPTGVHVDDGDLEEGYSAIVVLRRGSYTGGELCFPRYRVAVDLHDRDVLLMDAHEWHGNAGLQLGEGAERISVVCYYRTDMASCGTPAEELERAHVNAARRNA